jgi:hypothetical protein
MLTAPFLGIGVGAAYFIKANPFAPSWRRVLASSFGYAVALLYVLGVVLWPDSYRYNTSGVRTFYFLQLVPFVLLVYSLIAYPGPRRLHWLLVPLGLLAWATTFALGLLFIHGE